MTLRSVLDPLRRAQRDFVTANVRRELDAVFALEALVRLAHPFKDLDGAGELFARPLADAFPDLERRDLRVLDGDRLRPDFRVVRQVLPTTGGNRPRFPFFRLQRLSRRDHRTREHQPRDQ